GVAWGVAIQPFLGGEDRRGHSMGYQESDQLGVESPAAGVEGERRHFVFAERDRRNDLMHFDRTQCSYGPSGPDQGCEVEQYESHTRDMLPDEPRLIAPLPEPRLIDSV